MIVEKASNNEFTKVDGEFVFLAKVVHRFFHEFLGILGFKNKPNQLFCKLKFVKE